MRMIAVIAAGVALMTSRAAIAQDSTVVSPPAVNPIAYASALRDSGNFAQAADSLKALLAREPSNGDAARMLAQTLYWLKDVSAAKVQYEQAMTNHPEDVTLKLDYGRMLVETRDNVRASQVLQPLVGDSITRARASILLGTMDYWSGELSRAAREFKVALKADSQNADAARQLYEIRTIASPWISLRSSGLHDDQPLDRISGFIEGGFFVTPLSTLTASVSEDHFTSSDSLTANLIVGELSFNQAIPASRIDWTLAAGLAQKMRGSTSFTTLVERARARVRFPQSFAIEVGGGVQPYTSTVSSFAVESRQQWVSAILSRSGAAGFLGESAVRIERFQDENTVRNAYAWALAPLVNKSTAAVRAGYSISWEDAVTNRFVMLHEIEGTPPHSQFDLTGRYSPYFTPENIIAHAAIASITLKLSPGTTLSANGGYAFHATEDAPSFVSPPSSPSIVVKQFAQRSFHPWNAEARLQSTISNAASFSAAIEHMKTAFYSATTASIGITWKILPSPLR